MANVEKGVKKGVEKGVKKGVEKGVKDTSETVKTGLKLIRTADVGSYKDPQTGVVTSGVSEKLQKAGHAVHIVTGGLLGDRKTHYFKLTLKQAAELKGKDGKAILNADDLKLVEETDSVTPSVVNETGLREKLEKPEGLPDKEDTPAGDEGTE